MSKCPKCSGQSDLIYAGPKSKEYRCTVCNHVWNTRDNSAKISNNWRDHSETEEGENY